MYINQCIHYDQYPVLYIHLHFTLHFNKYIKLHQLPQSFYITLQVVQGHLVSPLNTDQPPVQEETTPVAVQPEQTLQEPSTTDKPP